MRNIIPIFYCSFCGKGDQEVDFLIVANKKEILGICNQCVSLCSDIIEKKRAGASKSNDESSKS